MGSAPIVELAGVSKAFDTPGGTRVPVLADLDLVIEAGEKASLIGPSGCGKSTLLSLIAGLVRCDTGSVVVDGVALDRLDDTRRARVRGERIGIALQSDNLIPFLSARENVELALGIGPRPRRPLRRRSMELLDRFGVAHRADHRPRHLSGGEAQRVALAVALANEPALLLADEVVAQLDGATAGQVVDEVLSSGFAVLFVTHDIALADRVERRYRFVGRRVEER
jgi:predicted ABC-type transport system involved in lysophospholipase L1 biosynthesis ATPase subunit